MTTLADVMDGLAQALVTARIVPDAVAYPVSTVHAPMGVVGYPDSIDLDATYRGASRDLTIPVYLVMGDLAAGKETRNRVSDFLGSPGGVSAAREALETVAGVMAVQTCRIEPLPAAVVKTGSENYLAAVFDCEVTIS